MPEEEFQMCLDQKVCAQIFKTITSELTKLTGKVDSMNEKLFQANGDSIVTRLAILERDHETIEEAVKDDRKARSKYTDMVASTMIHVVVTAIMGASALLILWERGMLT